ncbi:MAG: enoyl-CoA hydratase/isomerase family protein [Gammaproteobacteria bacterium]|nr:enoyl-CoA hydratase/isomerase family protein [Gammaproteobacteria bacterium]MBT6583757.1 enoyl-CoA hydratase/isomerase family protein [Gammaproteobacteria bacterium]MBT6893619.1 enoyl-CoA hydratase/isomerase family protein [Gammaproteobacteria bacterium]MBT7880410.1 enoyl-CoA hydratase/isomerase family protein [Gammaproteobacteria bacterium]
MINASLLKTLIREPNWADSAGEACLSVDVSGANYSSEEVQAIGQWLRRQPVPVIGLLNTDNRLLDAVDFIAETGSEVERLASLIDAHPQASAVLVQVTRVTMSLPVIAALTVESLGYATLQGGEEFSRWLSGLNKTKVGDSDISAPVLMERIGSELSILLNSPSNRNALSVSMRDGLSEAFSLVAMDDSIERVVVSGAGSCFSAGGDLTEFGVSKDVAEAHRIRQLKMPAQYLAEHAGRYNFNLHGACIGAGIELPAFAGHVSASRDAFFRLPEVAMGLIPGAGGCVSIPRRIGRHRTNYLAITGMELSAEKALSWGLIDELAD